MITQLIVAITQLPPQVCDVIQDYYQSQERQYLDAIYHILKNGNRVGDRTGVGVLSVLGVQMKFDLRDSFPLITTKNTFFRGIVEELLWILSGSTNAKELEANGVKIWNGNSSQQALDKLKATGDLKLDLKEGDCGAIYGFQLRRFGATYVDCHTNYNGKGFDQLAHVIHLLKTRPHDRRIVIDMWNPCDFDKQCLPCCHVLYQFYVSEEAGVKYLSCQMYQRSGDMFLGVPFNIASASLLTYLIAKVVGMKAKELIHVIGNAHIYNNHIEACKQQLTNLPLPFPKLKIKGDITRIEDFKFNDLELIGYKSCGKIAAAMAI